MPPKGGQFAVTVWLPQPYRLVTRPAGQYAAIGREGNAMHPISMSDADGPLGSALRHGRRTQGTHPHESSGSLPFPGLHHLALELVGVTGRGSRSAAAVPVDH